MEKTMFENFSHEERLEMFKANSEGVENRTYYEKLSQEDLTERRSRYAQRSIEVNKIEKEKKEVVESFKEQLKPIKSESSQLLEEITTGFQEKDGTIFKMVNRDEGMVGYYSEAGNLVESRPATREETSQLSITPINKAVNQ